MYTISATAPLNGDSGPILTPDQLWSGLEHHVRTSDLRFVPPGHDFEVVESHDDGVVRRATLHTPSGPVEFRQRISFHGRRVMAMSTEPLFGVRILSIEAGDDGAYRLRLTLSGEKPGAAHGSPQEREEAAIRRAAAQASVERFVETTRQMVKDGEL